jgi:hypothetical protein
MLSNHEFLFVHLIVQRALLQAFIATHPDLRALEREFRGSCELKTVQALFHPIEDRMREAFEAEREKVIQAIAEVRGSS